MGVHRVARLLSLVALLPVPALAQQLDLNVVSSVQVRRDGRVSVEVVGTKKPNFTTFSMPSPERLIIDVAEAVFQGVPAQQRIDADGITTISTASYGSDQSAIARVIIGFSRPVETDLSISGETTLVVRLAAGAAAVAGSEIPQKGGQAAETAAGNQGAADAERARAEEQRKLAEKSAAEERKRLAEEEQQRKLAEKKAAEEAAKAAAEEKKRLAEEEKQRKLAEKKAAEEAARAAAEERRRLAEEEKQRKLAEKKAAEEAARAAAEEKRRLAEEDRQRQLAERKAAEEEKRRLAEEERQRQLAQRQARQEDAARAAAQESRRADEETAAGQGQAGVLEKVGFRQLREVSRVSIKTSAQVAYRVREGEANTVILELLHTRLKSKNDRRMLDTSFFETAVVTVEPHLSGSSVLVEIKLKSQVPFAARQEGPEIHLDFRRPGAAADPSAEQGGDESASPR